MAVRPVPSAELLEPQLVVLLRERLLETPAPLEATTDLYALGLDSMAIMQLLILVEEEYGVSLPDGALTRENFSTVRQLARLVRAEARAAHV